jgi:hypothetical protein
MKATMNSRPSWQTNWCTLPRMWAVAFFVLTYVVSALLWLPAIRSGQPLAVVMQGRKALPIVIATIVR